MATLDEKVTTRAAPGVRARANWRAGYGARAAKREMRRQSHRCVVQASWSYARAPARSKARQNDQKGAGISPLKVRTERRTTERDRFARTRGTALQKGACAGNNQPM